MKLGIMQPYFFPYLGHFSLIARTDRWVVFDSASYQPRSWMNRNRILHPHAGWHYVTVPVASHPRGTPIHDIRLADSDEAAARISRQLAHYEAHRAPHVDAVSALVRRSFDSAGDRSLARLNVRTLSEVCDYLGIPFRYEILSDMGLDLPPIRHRGQWALEISDALGAREYVNPAGGRDLFRMEEFEARGIKLTFAAAPAFRYDTSPFEFVDHLSILDVMMWNSPGAIRAAILQ